MTFQKNGADFVPAGGQKNLFFHAPWEAEAVQR